MARRQTRGRFDARRYCTRAFRGERGSRGPPAAREASGFVREWRLERCDAARIGATLCL